MDKGEIFFSGWKHFFEQEKKVLLFPNLSFVQFSLEKKLFSFLGRDMGKKGSLRGRVPFSIQRKKKESIRKGGKNGETDPLAQKKLTPSPFLFVLLILGKASPTRHTLVLYTSVSDIGQAK